MLKEWQTKGCVKYISIHQTGYEDTALLPKTTSGRHQKALHYLHLSVKEGFTAYYIKEFMSSESWWKEDNVRELVASTKMTLISMLEAPLGIGSGAIKHNTSINVDVRTQLLHEKMIAYKVTGNLSLPFYDMQAQIELRDRIYYFDNENVPHSNHSAKVKEATQHWRSLRRIAGLPYE